MSLGYFFASSKPIQRELLAGIVRPEKTWLRDLMLLDQKNILLLTEENRMAQCLIQAACNDLRPLSQQEVFHFDFHRFLALVRSPVDASHLFEEFLEDLSHTKANTWIYIQNLDELLLHDDPAAKMLIQHVMRANYVSQCRLIITIRDVDNIALLQTQYAVFYHHTETLKLRPVTPDECKILLNNAVKRLERQYSFALAIGATSSLLKIMSRYVPRERLLLRTLEMIKIAVARLDATRSQTVKQELSLQAVLQVLSDWEQIPVKQLLHDVEGGHSLGEFLQQRVLGQEPAIETIADAVASNALPLFVFHGPRCCGKTLMAATLARYYNGSERFLIQIDLSQHQGDLRWENLFADSPDFNASLQPVLTIIKQTPNVVVAFKQAKSHLNELANLLLPAVHHRCYVQQDGTVIDFSSVKFVLLTAVEQIEGGLQPESISSSADDLLRLVCEPDEEYSFAEPSINHQLPQIVLPESLQSVATLVNFMSATDVTIKAIVEQKLNDYCSQMKNDHQVTVKFQDEVVDYLLQQVLHRDQGTKAINAVFHDYLHPAVEKSVICVDQTSGQQMLVLMLNDTGQLLMGQLMPYSQGRELQGE